MAAGGLKSVLPSQSPGQVPGKGWPGLLLPCHCSVCRDHVETETNEKDICKQEKNMEILYSSGSIQKVNKNHRFKKI